jgi:hypothetical protein
MKDFNYWKKIHDDGQLEEFSTDRFGLLWLKTKSVIRKEILQEFEKYTGIILEESNKDKQFKELFDNLSRTPKHSLATLDAFFKKINKIQLASYDTDKLVSELYKVKDYKWGGDHHNSLDKHLVSKYVKNIQSYSILESKFEKEINDTVRGYVLTSWFNHWSSRLIENIFKSNRLVLPNIGLIKNVDFFIGDIPFDLKVTYLPIGFIKEKRKEKGLKEELSFLKNKAREAKIPFDKNASPAQIYDQIVGRMKDKSKESDKFCRSVLKMLKDERIQILKEAQRNSKLLAKWLYENQGEMRMSSENRLFLVLVDTDEIDFSNSWKLKRNLDALEPKINSYLQKFKKKSIEDLRITFSYKDKPRKFSALTDVLFIVK